ncbi:MAG: hypothetical protein ACRCYY_11025 [Trueperaceae bacterium]
MVLAGGFHGMHAFGFGLGFLNFIGTILFFIFLFMLIKFFARGIRYAGYRNWQGRGDCKRSKSDWGKHAPWMREEFWQSREGGSDESEDEAMSVARERLAQSEITPKQFETLKGGLEVDMSDTLGRFDKAVHIARLRFAKGEISSEEFDC